MKLNSISGVTCLVKDIQQTSKFYEDLGFRIGKQDDGHVTCYVNWFWIDFIADAQPDTQPQSRGAGQSLHIKVENADEFYEGVVSKGMAPEGTPQGSRSSGRSFILRDPDGYQLVFFEKK